MSHKFCQNFEILTSHEVGHMIGHHDGKGSSGIWRRRYSLPSSSKMPANAYYACSIQNDEAARAAEPENIDSGLVLLLAMPGDCWHDFNILLARGAK